MFGVMIIVARVMAAVMVGWYKAIKAAAAAARANALCNSCVNVHSVKGFAGKELTFCNYSSELRAIKFAVCECTGFRDRNAAPAVRVAGFVRIDEIAAGEAFPATVVRIAAD
jgi:hypothetical protein